MNKQDTRGRTLLHQAVVKGRVGIVYGLLKIESVNCNIVDKDLYTPLCLAMIKEEYEIASILLE